MSAPEPRSRTHNPFAIALIVALCGVTLLVGYANKARCAGPPFDSSGKSLSFESKENHDVCYSDIQYLWLGRDIDQHVFPYVHGSITAEHQLIGGTVEYPVLTGVLMWTGAIGAHDDAAFLAHSALLLSIFGLLVAWMLARLCGWWALLWAIGPPLVLYAFHNWDLPAVAAAVGAVFVMAVCPWRLRTRAFVAAALLGVGVCLKLYPGLFVLPLALYVLYRGSGEDRAGACGPFEGRDRDSRDSRDVRGALGVLGIAALTIAVVNLPFAVTGPHGWWASFVFQSDRSVDITTDSIWYWGVRQAFSDDAAFQHFVGIASPVAVITACALALALGYRRVRRGEPYPWVEISGAMLCAFLLLHKVHSPQYMLWLLPFFVLIRVPWTLVAGYLLADLAIGIGLFRYFDALQNGGEIHRGLEQIVWFGVWGRAVGLVWMFVVCCRGRSRIEGRRDPVDVDERVLISS